MSKTVEDWLADKKTAVIREYDAALSKFNETLAEQGFPLAVVWHATNVMRAEYVKQRWLHLIDHLQGRSPAHRRDSFRPSRASLVSAIRRPFPTRGLG